MGLKKMKRASDWSKAWAGNVPETILLRDKWGHNHSRYMARWRPNDEQLLCILTDAMRCFTSLEERLLRRAEHARLLRAGQDAFDSLLHPGQADIEYEFAAIDFEGCEHSKGTLEFGITKFSSWQIANQAPAEVLRSYNFALRSKGEQKFLFGSSTRLSSEILPRTILDELRVSSQRSQLILVGHGIHGYLANMRALGIHLEDLPQLAGIVDTAEIARDVLGRRTRLSLECLLRDVDVPFHWHHLHCGGNDARYTMQAMLALLHLRATGRQDAMVDSERQARLEYLSTVARQPLRRKIKTKVDFADMEDCLEGGLFEGL